MIKIYTSHIKYMHMRLPCYGVLSMPYCWQKQAFECLQYERHFYKTRALKRKLPELVNAGKEKDEIDGRRRKKTEICEPWVTESVSVCCMSICTGQINLLVILQKSGAELWAQSKDRKITAKFELNMFFSFRWDRCILCTRALVDNATLHLFDVDYFQIKYFF